MKKILTFLLINLSLLFGQNDNSECPVNLSIFAEYAKVKIKMQLMKIKLC